MCAIINAKCYINTHILFTYLVKRMCVREECASMQHLVFIMAHTHILFSIRHCAYVTFAIDFAMFSALWRGDINIDYPVIFSSRITF